MTTLVEGGVAHLRQLLGNVSTHKHGLKIHPQVLNHQPVFDDLSGVGQLLHPKLNVFLERSIVPAWKDSMMEVDLFLKTTLSSPVAHE